LDSDSSPDGLEERIWFTEGFDTVDLKDAKALLDELNAVSPIAARRTSPI
jgi:hypothetical protein